MPFIYITSKKKGLYSIVSYLSEPLKRAAMNNPGTPVRYPSLSMTKKGKTYKTNSKEHSK